jgi:hypothetical protein
MESVKRLLLLSVVLACLCLPCGAQEQDYVIKLERPGKVGDKFDVKITAAVKRERTQTVAGEARPAQAEVTAVELDAEGQLEELDKRGLEKRIAFTVRKCVIVEGDQESQLLPKGAVFTAEASKDGTKFALRGRGKLTAEQERALGLVMHLSDEEAASMDDLYGTDKRQKAGASWKPNVERMVKNAAHYGMIVKPEDLEGSVQFVGVEEVDGRQRTKVAAEAKIKRFELKPEDKEGKPRMPPGVKLVGGTRESSFTGFYGTDPADTWFSGSSSSVETYRIEGKLEDGTELKSEAKTTHTIVVESVPK